MALTENQKCKCGHLARHHHPDRFLVKGVVCARCVSARSRVGGPCREVRLLVEGDDQLDPTLTITGSQATAQWEHEVAVCPCGHGVMGHRAKTSDGPANCLECAHEDHQGPSSPRSRHSFGLYDITRRWCKYPGCGWDDWSHQNGRWGGVGKHPFSPDWSAPTPADICGCGHHRTEHCTTLFEGGGEGGYEVDTVTSQCDKCSSDLLGDKVAGHWFGEFRAPRPVQTVTLDRAGGEQCVHSSRACDRCLGIAVADNTGQLVYLVTAGEYDGYRVLEVFTGRDADLAAGEYAIEWRDLHHESASVETKVARGVGYTIPVEARLRTQLDGQSGQILDQYNDKRQIDEDDLRVPTHTTSAGWQRVLGQTRRQRVVTIESRSRKGDLAQVANEHQTLVYRTIANIHQDNTMFLIPSVLHPTETKV